jgi:AP-2 complex subunit mu-1
VTLHQCVNLGRFNTEKVVSFVPPDGEFELMKYRCQEGISLPFKARALLGCLIRTEPMHVRAHEVPLPGGHLAALQGAPSSAA